MIYASKNEAVSCEIQTHFKSFSPARFTESFGRNSTIYVSKKEVVRGEVQNILDVVCLQGLQKVLGAISQFMCPKTKLFALKFRRILEVFTWKIYRQSSGRTFAIYVSQNEALSCEVQTHFGCFHPARLIKQCWAH